MFVGSWAWILTLCLLALAISAWVKWRPVARVTLVTIVLVSRGFALAFDERLDTWVGKLISVTDSALTIWGDLFGIPPSRGELEMGRVMPIWAAWMALAVACLLSLWLLSRRIRAYEVVR
jgi:ABC-2 type transport system permease protein